jgi:hypothetical protein
LGTGIEEKDEAEEGVGTFYPIVFSLASLGERFVDETSTYLVIFQTPRVSEYESTGSTG